MRAARELVDHFMQTTAALRAVAISRAEEITSTGLESDQAWPMGVRILVRPGQ